ncbi:gamma-glutamylcysteine synthetase [Aphelenchoides avenae]|nr:gamma-glutamylcysteine synthetase [Aphelenchus avenae]
MDELLAKHVAHMFIRDPLQVFEGRIRQDDEKDTEHFETIQSSIWMNMRFKPPPAGSSIGWRVEFRPMELQLTDFENAAYACFVVLLARILLTHKLSFVMPISQVNENITRSQRRDAVLREKLRFRSNVFAVNECETVEMTLNEIVNGNNGFPGLVPLIRRYLSEVNIDASTLDRLHRYLDLIQMRASGELWTLSHWMRDFVATHPLYKRDSYVSEEIVYDMLAKMKDIADGKAHSDKLLGKLRSLAATVNDAKNGAADKERTSLASTTPVYGLEPLRMRKR